MWDRLIIMQCSSWQNHAYHIQRKCPIDPTVPRGHFYPLFPYPVSDFLSKICAETCTVFFPRFPFHYHKIACALSWKWYHGIEYKIHVITNVQTKRLQITNITTFFLFKVIRETKNNTTKDRLPGLWAGAGAWSGASWRGWSFPPGRTRRRLGFPWGVWSPWTARTGPLLWRSASWIGTAATAWSTTSAMASTVLFDTNKSNFSLQRQQ